MSLRILTVLANGPDVRTRSEFAGAKNNLIKLPYEASPGHVLTPNHPRVRRHFSSIIPLHGISARAGSSYERPQYFTIKHTIE